MAVIINSKLDILLELINTTDYVAYDTVVKLVNQNGMSKEKFDLWRYRVRFPRLTVMFGVKGWHSSRVREWVEWFGKMQASKDRYAKRPAGRPRKNFIA